MIINLKLWCNDNRMGVGFSMMKRLLLAVIVMFACVGGVVLSPKDGILSLVELKLCKYILFLNT